MRVYFSPIVGLNEIEYEFLGDSVVVTIDRVSDTFDFSDIPDGVIDYMSIETTLNINPIIYAEKIDGVLFLKLLNPIPENATDFQKFPNWIEVGEDNGEV